MNGLYQHLKIFSLIIYDIAVQIIETLLPWFVLNKKRIAFVFFYSSRNKLGILHAIYDATIKQKESVAD